MVDGLWVSGTSLTGDFATIVYRLKLLGFNAVRLPFSFKNLYGGTVQDFTQSCSTDSLGTVAMSTTDPSVGFSGAAPEPEYMPPQTSGVCNSSLPNDSVLDRFMFVLDLFARNGMYVMIDDHLNLDSSITDDPDAWVQSWKSLATTISQAPEVWRTHRQNWPRPLTASLRPALACNLHTSTEFSCDCDWYHTWTICS